jgi:hypothetical protein
MGSTGSVTATADGTWSAAFNDDYRGDNNGSFTLKVPAPTVTFTNYDLCAGFDDWTEFQSGGDNKVWVSVPVNGNNTVKAIITPADQAQTISFTNLTPSIATVSPTKATSAIQELTITGVTAGEAQIDAKFLGQTVASFKVDVLPLKSGVTVALYYVTDGTNVPSNVPSNDALQTHLNSVFGRQANVFCTVSTGISTNFHYDVDPANGTLDTAKEPCDQNLTSSDWVLPGRASWRMPA